MRIVIDVRHLTKSQPSGVGQYTAELLKALFDLDKANEYILFSSGSKRARKNIPVFDYPNVKNLHINLPNRILNFFLLAFNRPHFDDLIKGKFGPAEKTIFFFPNLNFISLTPGTPYVLTLHDLSFEIFPEFFKPKDRWWHHLSHPRQLAQDAQKIIVPSNSTSHDVAKIFNVLPEKISVIPHGVNKIFSHKIEPRDFGIKSRYHLPKKFALFVGTLEPRKNISTIIKAVEEYRKITKDDLGLVLVGRDSERAVTLGRATARPNIRTLGYLPDSDRPALYRLAAVTLFPSIYEGFGLSIVESVACGTPVITSRTSAMPEVGGEATIYVDPYNVNDLVAALKELLTSPDLQKQKIAAGLEQTKRFSWEKTAKETLKTLQNNNVL